MQVSIKWLHDYIDFTETAEELADKLTMAGIPVENVIRADDGLDGRNAVALEVFHQFAAIYRGEAEPIASMDGIEVLFKDRIGHVEVGQPVVGLLHVFRARFDALGLGGGGRHHALLQRGGKGLNAFDGA